MKKIVISLVAAGMVSALSAADLGSADAAFLFGNDSVDAVAMSGEEMVQTEGQLLAILTPVLGVVTGLPILGTLLTPVVGAASPLLSAVDGLLVGILGLVPAVLNSALPVKLDLGLELGTLLSVKTGLQVQSALPTLVGNAVKIL